MIRLSPLISSVLLFILVAPSSVAQSHEGFFIEPEVRTTNLLGEPVALVGLRLGSNHSNGLAYDIGVSLLVGSVSTNPPGRFAAGDAVEGLRMASGGLRYSGPLTEAIRYEFGGFVMAGYGTGSFCGQTDSCGAPSSYVGAGPQAKISFAFQKWIGISVGGTYPFDVHQDEMEASGPSISLGIRFRP
jgi:hypothetical protein